MSTATKKKSKAGRKPKAKKAKAAVKLVKNETKPRVKKEVEGRNIVAEMKQLPQARDGEKSGEFIRRVLELNALTNAEIVELVSDQFKNSKASANDVAFHRYNMKKEGMDVKVVRVDKEGVRYTL